MVVLSRAVGFRGRDVKRRPQRTSTLRLGPKGKPVIVDLPFSRGKRVSALAALNHTGLIAWKTTTGTVIPSSRC